MRLVGRIAKRGAAVRRALVIGLSLGLAARRAGPRRGGRAPSPRPRPASWPASGSCPGTRRSCCTTQPRPGRPRARVGQ